MEFIQLLKEYTKLISIKAFRDPKLINKDVISIVKDKEEPDGLTWFILHHKELDQYVKIEGYKDSYCGEIYADIEDCASVVYPKTRTVTYFE